MRKGAPLFLALCALVLVLAGVGAAWDDNGHKSESVWVVNRDKGEVTIFNARSGKPEATMTAGAGAHEVGISARAGKAFIANENENTISVFSTETFDQHKLALGPRPHHLEPSRSGRTVVVGLVGSNEVAAIAARSEATRRYFSSGNAAARAHGPYLHRGTIYVAHETGDEVTGVDADTGAIVLSVTGISQASEVLPDRRRNRLYASARGEGKIKVIDLATKTISGEVALGVGAQPEGLLLTRDRKTLIVTLRGTPAQLAFVDVRSLTLSGTVELAGAGSFGDLAAFSRSGRLVYATFDRGTSGIGGVAVVDVKRRSVIATWDYPGSGRPHGIAVSH